MKRIERERERERNKEQIKAREKKREIERLCVKITNLLKISSRKKEGIVLEEDSSSLKIRISILSQ